jgi:hypothetical protein
MQEVYEEEEEEEVEEEEEEEEEGTSVFTSPPSPTSPTPYSLIKYLKMGKVVIMFCVVAAKILYRGYQKLIVVVDLFGFVLAIRHILRA